jgi:F-type H+-transporting ATPase subunit b
MGHLTILASEGPNGPILASDINEVIWGSIAFFVIAFLLVWKGGPPIVKAWNGRIQRIEGELDAAAGERGEAEARQRDIAGRVADLDAEHDRILTEAHETATSVKAQIAERAQAEAAELTARARTDIEASRAQAMADLHHEVADLALGAAEAVVANSLDAGRQNDLIERYIDTVGSPS